MKLLGMDVALQACASPAEHYIDVLDASPQQ